jgi:branched-subunit amino acid ABC-type transport system permease component
VSTWAPFVVSGLVVGSIYAIAAMGLVVTYRTTGLFSFAHGATGMAVAYAFYTLREDVGMPTALAFVLALGVVAPALGMALERLLFRGIDQASQTTKVVVTMGLLIVLQGSAVAVYGANPKPFEPFLPSSTFRVASVNVGWDQLIIVLVGAGVLAALGLFFGRSRTGTVMRALVDDRELVQAAGFSATRLGSLTWALGAVTAGLAGILFSPLLGLDSVILTLLVVQAYAAAILGRLTSLPRTYVGAMALGLTGALSLKVFASQPTLLNGLRPSIPFLFLLGALVLSRRGTLRELGSSAPWAGTVGAGTGSWWPLLVLLLPATALLSETRVFSLGFALVIACAFLSLTVLTGTSGLISLTQAGLVGTGAFAYIHLVNAGVPFWIALPLGGLLVVPLGVAIAVPALRLSGLFLALATFGFGQLIDGLLFGSWTWFSGGSDGLRGGRPSLFDTDRTYVAFVVVVLAAIVAAMGQLRRTGLGRTLVALRDSPAAADALGVDPLWPRVAIFSISAFVAGVAGGLYGGLLEGAGSSFFNSFTSVLWLTIAVVGGIQSAYGAVVAALLFYFVPALFSGGEPSPWLTPAFGLGAVLLARRPGGLVGLLADRWPRRLIVVRRDLPPTNAGLSTPAEAMADG